MSTIINTGWLNDDNGDKFAPKTLSSQVITSDGITLESKIQTDLDTLHDLVGDTSVSDQINTALDGATDSIVSTITPDSIGAADDNHTHGALTIRTHDGSGVTTEIYYEGFANEVDVAAAEHTHEEYASGLDLLWTNSSPTTGMPSSSGVISLEVDISSYSFFVIVFGNLATKDGNRTTCQIFNEDGTTQYAHGMLNLENTSNLVFYGRTATISHSNNQIAFSNGYYHDATAATRTSSADAFIPYKIYGLK